MSRPVPPSEGLLAIPGQPWSLRWRRDADGRLVELGCGTRTHMVERGGARHFGDGLAVVEELHTGARLLRFVRAGDGTGDGGLSIEEYRTDANGRLCHVDGVDVRRDAVGRVVGAGAWSYQYDGDALVGVDGPFGRRRIERDARGRARRLSDRGALSYDAAGRRTDVAPLPATHHRDALGRLWTIVDGRGAVLATYLWEGPWCLGRIDGDARAPLAAVFSLDPTGTPVRAIERGRLRLLPRDAFGEALLDEPGVPGLYGGTLHEGLCYLAARALDPRAGSFCAPDPWSGGDADPRRAGGYRGPLFVERPGDYVVCRNDPIDRADPTGCISGSAALVAFSSLTWASPTTIFSVVGFDLSLNFWLSLFTGNIGDYFTSFGDGLAARRHGGFGVRRGGLLGLQRPFTIGHYVMSDTETFNGLDLIAAFVPSVPMPLSGYGTLLRLTPADGKGSFLLDGSAGIAGVTPARGWTRGGTAGTPVYPGAQVARYDSGALHIDRTQTTPAVPNNFPVASANVHGPQACSLTELVPTGGWAAGISLSNLIAVTLTGTSLGIGIGNLELLTDTAGTAVIASVLGVVESNGNTELTLEATGAGLVAPLRLQALGPAGSTEIASALASPAGSLSTVATAAPYAKGDPLRLSQTSGAAGLVPVGSAVIQRLEAQLALDAAVPDTFTALSLTVVSALGVGGPASVTSGTTMNCSGAVPPIPSLVAITVGATTVPAVATAVAPNPAGGQDVTLAPAVAISGTGSWAPLVAAGGAFGSAQRPDAAPATTITYLPAAPRATPAAGTFVRIDASNQALTVRTVTAVNYDALVLGASLPGNPAVSYSVERFPLLGIDQSGLKTQQKQGLDIDPTLTPPTNQTLAGLSLRLHELAGPTLAAAAAGVAPVLAAGALTVAGPSLTASLTAIVTPPNPSPGQLMMLSDGAGKLELTVVTDITLTVNCDRAWAGPASALEAFRINNAGPTFPATLVGSAPLVLTVGNTLATAAGTVISEMPRFIAGEIVRLAWTEGATARQDIFSVSAVESLVAGGVVLVDSTTLTLVGGGIAPAATAAGFSVTRQVPVAPGPRTGSAREGIKGSLGASLAGEPNPTMKFSVWAVGALSGPDYAVSDGTTTLPMRFMAPSVARPAPLPITPPIGLTINLGASPASFAPGTSPLLLVPTLAAAPPPAVPPAVPAVGSVVYAASFAQTNNVVRFTVHPDEPNVLGKGTGNIIVVVTFGPGTAVPTSGRLSSGTVLIPEDTSFELDGKEALVEHETRHTMQYAWFGPIMWGFYPLLPLLEKVYPGFDKADYSPYFDGELIEGSGGTTIRLSNLGATTVAAGDSISAGQNIPVKLDRLNPSSNDSDGAHSFLIANEDFTKMRAVADSGGKLKVRKVQSRSGFLNVLLKTGPAFLTPGGVTEALVANTWGWFVYGIARLIYGIRNCAGNGGGATYPAKVSSDGTGITLTDAAGKASLRGASRIIVQKDKSTLVRTAAPGAADGALTLTEPLPFKDTDVRVTAYGTHQPASDWDWSSYYPAKVPDKNRPATIAIEAADAAGTNRLTLALRDEVLLRTGTTSKKSVVSAVNADGTYDLEDPPLTAIGTGNAPNQEFRVAKVGEHDPVGSLGGLTANFIGAPWLGKLCDPWAWVLSKPNVNPGSFGDWSLRVLRWLSSSHAWSLVVPGWLFVDDLFYGTSATKSWMEQDASENSGDLYTSLGRLENAPSIVGDIGRYWFFPNGRSLSNYPSRQFDAPGAQINREVVVAPLVTNESASAAGTINKNAGAPTPSTSPPAGGGPLPFGPGDVIPDALYAKPVNDPRAALPGSNPPSFTPTDRGLIPLRGAVQRTEGEYVAFTRPGKHRVTISESFQAGTLRGETAAARGVVDSGAGRGGFKSVTLFFDRTIADISVVVAGVTVANEDTVTLVATQTAVVAVTPPDPRRRYAPTLLRPLTGPLLRADTVGNDPNTIQVQAPSPLPATPVEPVELCRVYRFDPSTGSFDDSGLNAFKMTLPGDLRIPVRRFNVAVTTTVTARSKVSTSPADDVTELTPGTDVFVLVPASIVTDLAVAITYSPPAPASTQDPVVTVTVEPIPADLAKAGVTGTAYRIHCDPGDPPELVATLGLTVVVGVVGGLQATLTGTLTLKPTFVLDPVSGTSFQVNRGGTLQLVAHDLNTPPNDVNVSSVDPIAGVAPTPTNATIALVVDGAAAPGTRRVIATSAAPGGAKAARTITIV